ncbi:hypothetical protein [Nocardia sp. NPDC051570]|uniref:hypothetical protein n=1 Tax=Nocardia sp. NPDC051570 TaxID=3364324 RepID=UPI00379BF208
MKTSSETEMPGSAVIFEYSQTGQLTETVDALVAPLRAAGWQVRRVRIELAAPYPFPWPITRFFGVFPACTDERAVADLAPPSAEMYSSPGELVILAYQVWYLAPSLPARALLLRHREIFAGRDVLTVVACRNMWYSAVAETNRHLAVAGARGVGTITTIDTRAQFLTLVTTLRWLLLGRRDGALFGRAGVGGDELARVGALGIDIARTKSRDEIAAALRAADSAPVVPMLAAADMLAGKEFRRWGAVIRQASRFGAAARVTTLTGFVGSLGLAIAVGFPILAAAELLGGSRFDRIVRTRLAASLRMPVPAGAAS